MQTPNVRGYSEFFTSGFRAVTNRPRRSSYTRNSLDEPNATAPSTRRTLADLTQHRSRPTSMILRDAAPHTAAAVKAERRRSSFVTFSSRLFDRITSSPFEEASVTSSQSQRSSRSSRLVNLADENIPEVWITTGGPYTPSAPNGSPALHQSIDPFASSPDSKSVLVDLPSENSPMGTPKLESFLSLSSSARSSRRSSVRERPTSIQTMPLPSRSRRSSFQYRPPSQEKSDFFWIVEEEPTGSLMNESISENNDDWDAPAKIDWHQFHIDILTDEA